MQTTIGHFSPPAPASPARGDADVKRIRAALRTWSKADPAPRDMTRTARLDLVTAALAL